MQAVGFFDAPLAHFVQEQKDTRYGVVGAFATMSQPQALTVTVLSKKVIYHNAALPFTVDEIELCRVRLKGNRKKVPSF